MYAGSTARSFEQASGDLAIEAELTITAERIRRATEGIGDERVTQRRQAVEAWQSLPLPLQRQSRQSHIPTVACIQTDGGRLQVRLDEDAGEGAAGEPPSDPRRRFWRESKVACLLRMTSEVCDHDPCPNLPATFANIARVAQLSREIKGFSPLRTEPEEEAPAAREEAETVRAGRPQLLTRHVLAMRAAVEEFGAHVAVAAWEGGFFQAERKAFVADGQASNWTIWRRYFSDFTAILDFVHAVCYVFQAAAAGRALDDVADVYRGWAQLLWSGRTTELIAAVEARLAELGPPLPSDGETHPRSIVQNVLGYLRNQAARMNYSEYRRRGLPITSAYVESTIKQINRRVKGTEKFWGSEGAQTLLQLSADYLSDRTPLDQFWRDRPAQATGLRTPI